MVDSHVQYRLGNVDAFQVGPFFFFSSFFFSKGEEGKEEEEWNVWSGLYRMHNVTECCSVMENRGNNESTQHWVKFCFYPSL